MNRYNISVISWKRIIVTRAYPLTFLSMITAHEAARLRKEMSPEERFQAVREKVKEKTQAILDQKIREVVAACESKVDIVLRAKDCTDKDEDIRAFLYGCGYSEVKVTSDFPGYCESYEGSTHIRFTIPG